MVRCVFFFLSDLFNRIFLFAALSKRISIKALIIDIIKFKEVAPSVSIISPAR